jgi:hypothetical protein
MLECFAGLERYITYKTVLSTEYPFIPPLTTTNLPLSSFKLGHADKFVFFHRLHGPPVIYFSENFCIVCTSTTCRKHYIFCSPKAKKLLLFICIKKFSFWFCKKKTHIFKLLRSLIFAFYRFNRAKFILLYFSFKQTTIFPL